MNENTPPQKADFTISMENAMFSNMTVDGAVIDAVCGTFWLARLYKAALPEIVLVVKTTHLSEQLQQEIIDIGSVIDEATDFDDLRSPDAILEMALDHRLKREVIHNKEVAEQMCQHQIQTELQHKKDGLCHRCPLSEQELAKVPGFDALVQKLASIVLRRFADVLSIKNTVVGATMRKSDTALVFGIYCLADGATCE